jgi:hypothetical protein
MAGRFPRAITGSIVAALGACTTPTVVNGTVTGDSLTVKDAMTLDGSQSGENVPDAAGIVVIASTSGICPAFQNNTVAANATQLVLTLYRTDSGGNVKSPGTGDYTINNRDPVPANSAIAVAAFAVTGATCGPVPGQGGIATSGTVHLSSMSLSTNGGAQGTFDLTFETDHLTGSFDAPFCDAPNGQMQQTCM